MKKTFRLSERMRMAEATTAASTTSTTTTTASPLILSTGYDAENRTFGMTDGQVNGSDIFYVVEEQPE